MLYLRAIVRGEVPWLRVENRVSSRATSPRQRGPALQAPPTVLLLTSDGWLRNLVNAACQAPWVVKNCVDPPSRCTVELEPSVKLAVLDDEGLPESERGWLLNQIHSRQPNASVVYVASHHSPEVEKLARAAGVLYYTSKPVDAVRLSEVLRRATAGRPRNRPGHEHQAATDTTRC